MIKNGRNYILEVQGRDGTVTIKPPFTLEFESHRTYYSDANYFRLRLYNMSKLTRDRIRKDVYADYFRLVSLRAGYGEQMPEIINGNITRCWTTREGNNYITEIEGFDAGFAFVNSAASQQYVSGTPQKSIIEDLVKSLKTQGVQIGAIGDYQGEISRGNSYVGSTTDILAEITGGGFFIDNGVAHALKDDEVLDDKVLVINAKSGLLGTPMLQETIVNLEILFEPMVKIGQMVSLESITEDRFNGIYKVTSIHHKGTISETVSGSATTQLGLVSGKFTPVARAI